MRFAERAKEPKTCSRETQVSRAAASGSGALEDKLLLAPSGLKARETPYGLVVLLARQRRPRFMRALPTLVEDLLDVVGRPYDGVNYVLLDDVRETMLDPSKSDHPLPPWG